MIELAISVIVAVIFLYAYIAPYLNEASTHNSVHPIIRGSCTVIYKGLFVRSGNVPGAARFSVYEDYLVISDVFNKKIYYSTILSAEMSTSLFFFKSISITIPDRSGEIAIFSRRSDDIYKFIIDKRPDLEKSERK